MKKKKTKKLNVRATNDLGLFLKENRLKKGLSQGDFAHLLKYDSPQYISDWERGVSSPPMKKLVRISQVLEVNMDKIFALLLDFSKQRLISDMSRDYLKVCKKP